ncbi:unnamed protein product, partial [Symbiodinium necroappetens]
RWLCRNRGSSARRLCRTVRRLRFADARDSTPRKAQKPTDPFVPNTIRNLVRGCATSEKAFLEFSLANARQEQRDSLQRTPAAGVQSRLRPRTQVGVPIDQVPRGLRLDDLLRLVEDHKEWLQGPTARGTGRKNMYDVTPELIIARSPGDERIIELTAEDAEKITQSLAGSDDEKSHGVFVKGSLQCREGAKLGGVPVENLVIQGILGEEGPQRRDYWSRGSERQERWRTTGRHGRRLSQDPRQHGASAVMQAFGDGINGGLGHLQDVIPEKLLGKQLGELNARRQKELLKKPGTVVVLRTGAP